MDKAGTSGAVLAISESGNQPAVIPAGMPLSPNDILGRKQLIESVVKQVMVRDTHYGIIPGTKNYSLLKPGADMLMSIFQVAAVPEVVDIETPGSGNGECHIRVLCKGLSTHTGMELGAGVGECSTYETKYRWRKAKGNEFKMAKDSGLETKIATKNKSGGGTYEEYQVRQEPGDMTNTILKMAKKRALADMVITLLGVSDMFDKEDPSSSQGNARPAKAPYQQPPSQSYQAPKESSPPKDQPKPNDPINDGMLKHIALQLDRYSVKPEALCEAFDIIGITELTHAQINEATNWIRDNAKTTNA